LINGADSFLEDNYIEIILKHFKNHPDLVITSGTIPNEKINLGHVHGSAGRVYRMEFFRETCKGRYELGYAWESIPLYKGKVQGKLVRHYKTPIVHHLRPRNTNAPIIAYFYRGIAKREVGYWFVYLLRLSLHVIKKYKRLKAGILLIVGFLTFTTDKYHIEGLKELQKRRFINKIKVKLRLI
jgi:hypothetical protein